MAEIINSNVFDATKKFVDFTGLDYFWEKAKAYIDVEDSAIKGRLDTAEGKITTLETTVGDDNSGLVKAVATLRSEVDALGGVEGGIQGMIDSSIAELTNADGTGSLDVAIAGAKQDALDAVKDLADGAVKENADAIDVINGDGEGSIAKAKQDALDAVSALANGAVKENADAIDAVEGALELHVSDAVAHITAQERIDWNAAKTAIDTFLKDAELDAEGVNVIDTLKELQTYVGSDDTATALITRVGDLETAVDTINGTETEEGSIAKAKKDALDAVSALANGAVKENADAIDVINGDGEGSIAKAKADALDAVSALANGAVKENADAIDVINGDGEGSIAKAKADAIAQAQSDAAAAIADALKSYYTKTEVDDLLEANSVADKAYAAAYTDALFTSFQFALEADIDGLFKVEEKPEE